VTVSKMGPMIAVGSGKAQSSKMKLALSGESCLEQLERGIKQHKGWPAASTSGAPLREPDILKLHI
jgi:hypothetical protein